MAHQFPIGSAPFIGLDTIQHITLAERRGFGALPTVTALPEMFTHEHQAQLHHSHPHAHQAHHHHGMPMQMGAPMSAPPTTTGMSTPTGVQTPKVDSSAPVAHWTQEDDRRLRAAVENVSCGRNGSAGSSANAAALSGTAGKSWQRIALVAFPNGPHDKDACAARWKALNQPSSIKGPWSKQEDKQLIRLVDQYGPEHWVTIAEKLGTRTGKQCRERWHNHVDPTINKTSFTPEEDAIIMNMYDKIGSKWAEMSKVLKGRPDNAIKNHYNTTLVRRRKLMEAVGKQQQQQHQQQQQQQFHHVQHQILPPTPMSAPPMVHAQDPMFVNAMMEHRRYLLQQQQNENANAGMVVPDGTMSSPYITEGCLPMMPFRLEDQENEAMPRFAPGAVHQFQDRFGMGGGGGSMMARSASIPAQSHVRLGLPIPLQRSTSYTNGFVPPPPAPGTFINPDEFNFMGAPGENASSSFADPSSIQFGGFGNLPHMVISSQESYNNLTPPPPPPGVSLDMVPPSHLHQMHESLSEGVSLPSSHQDWQLEHMMQAAASQQSLHHGSQASDASGLYATYGNMLGVTGMPVTMVLSDHSPQDAFAHASLPELSSAGTSPFFGSVPLGMPGSATTTHVQAGTVMQHQHSQQLALEARQQLQQEQEIAAIRVREAQLHAMAMQQQQQQQQPSQTSSTTASSSSAAHDSNGRSTLSVAPSKSATNARGGVSPKTSTMELSDKPSKKRKHSAGLTTSDSRDAKNEGTSSSKADASAAASSSSSSSSIHRDSIAGHSVKLPSMPESPFSPRRPRERLPSLAAVAGAEALNASPTTINNAAAVIAIRNRSRTSSLLGIDETHKALLPAFKQQMSASAHKAAAAAAVANVLAANGGSGSGGGGKDRDGGLASGRSSPGGTGLSAIVLGGGTPSSASRRLRSGSQLSEGGNGDSPSRRMAAPPLKRSRLSSLSTDILPSTIASSNFTFSVPSSAPGEGKADAAAGAGVGDTSTSSARSSTSSASGSSSSSSSHLAMLPALSADSSMNSNSTRSMTLLMSPDDIEPSEDYTSAKVLPPPSVSSATTSAGILGSSMLGNFASFVLPPSLDGYGFSFGNSLSPSGPSMTSSSSSSSSALKEKNGGNNGNGNGTTSHMVANLLGLHHAHHQQGNGNGNDENDPSGGNGHHSNSNSSRMTFGNSHLRIGSNSTGTVGSSRPGSS
ncbi:unnamed protein product [Tilletia controversa]|nr:unnamed protein product [Tilletia controversa]